MPPDSRDGKNFSKLFQAVISPNAGHFFCNSQVGVKDRLTQENRCSNLRQGIMFICRLFAPTFDKLNAALLCVAHFRTRNIFSSSNMRSAEHRASEIIANQMRSFGTHCDLQFEFCSPMPVGTCCPKFAKRRPANLIPVIKLNLRSQ